MGYACGILFLQSNYKEDEQASDKEEEEDTEEEEEGR